MKTDKSIRNICLASIRRHTIKPFDFTFTRLFENDGVLHDAVILERLSDNELPISETFVDNNNWTLVTTRQIITCKQGVERSIRPTDVYSWTWDDFKGIRTTPYTLGTLRVNEQQNLEVFIETGRASIVIIYAIRTLVYQLA
jgi:hypothetical protein